MYQVHDLLNIAPDNVFSLRSAAPSEGYTILTASASLAMHASYWAGSDQETKIQYHKSLMGTAAIPMLCSLLQGMQAT